MCLVGRCKITLVPEAAIGTCLSQGWLVCVHVISRVSAAAFNELTVGSGLGFSFKGVTEANYRRSPHPHLPAGR